jgi:hypothetical protein
MKPRCTWTGYLKISLVTVPVRVYTAISTTEKITFNQLHKSRHQRIRQKLVCPNARRSGAGRPGEPLRFAAKLFEEHTIFLLKIIDHRLLVSIHPTSNRRR